MHNQVLQINTTESLHTITAISQAKKKLDHVNIELDGRFWINIDKNELLKHNLFKGKEIDDETKLQLEEVAADNKLMDKVYNFLSLRPKSVKEVRDYLIYRRELNPEKADQIISDLIAKDFLSDQQFTKWYLENRLTTGVHGVQKITAELLKKGVSKKTIDQILANYRAEHEEYVEDSIGKIVEYASKILPRIKAKDKYELKQKLIMRLQSRGFGYDEINKAIKQLSFG